MKVSKLALSAMIASACLGGTAFGQNNRTAPRYYPASYYSYYQDGAAAKEATPAPAATPEAPAPVASSSCCGSSPACDVAAICNGQSSCDSLACGCGLGSSCDSGCGCSGSSGGLLSGLGGNCCIGEPWKLFKDGIGGVNVGGWTSIGYHDKANRFSFNDYDGRVQLGQQWLFAEKIADGSCGLGFGGRVDYVYGTDGPDTQAFGIAEHWDTNWDNGGAYGHALPQLYGEVAMGDLSVKVGKFFTIIGNEVVQSTGNFFYSRQFTFYNAEPFTHTGALSTYNFDEDTQLYNGYVMGWDSGFDDNGDAYISGIKRKVNDSFSVLYTSVLGRFADSPAVAERGSLHNIILTMNLSEKLTYINQTDFMYTKDGANTTQRNTFGNINYLIYKVNDCVSFGQRFEWFNYGGNGFVSPNGGAARRNDDLINYTAGINYRRNANLMFRPEVRWVRDATRYGFNEQNATNQVAAGGDVVFTF